MGEDKLTTDQAIVLYDLDEKWELMKKKVREKGLDLECGLREVRLFLAGALGSLLQETPDDAGQQILVQTTTPQEDYELQKLDERWQKTRDDIYDRNFRYDDGLQIFLIHLEIVLNKLKQARMLDKTLAGSGRLAKETSSSLSDNGILDKPRDDGDSVEIVFMETLDLTPSRLPDPRLVKIVGPGPIEECRTEMEQFYRRYGYDGIHVPLPDVVPEELFEWRKEGQELLYRPPEARVSTQDLMTAFDQGDCWAVFGSEAQEVVLEPAARGYWFLAESQENCPRTGRTYDDFLGMLPKGHRFLSLEEYAILWHFFKDFGKIIDLATYNFLRTQYKDCVLYAFGNIQGRTIEFLVRALGRKYRPSQKIGVRFCREIPSIV